MKSFISIKTNHPEFDDLVSLIQGFLEKDVLEVFIDGKKAVTLRGPTVAADFKAMVIDYIDRRYGAANRTAAE